MADALKIWWSSLGVIGPCVLLIVLGILFIIAAIRRWQWLYPDHVSLRYRSESYRRVWLFSGGIILIVFSILLYCNKDYIDWH